MKLLLPVTCLDFISDALSLFLVKTKHNVRNYYNRDLTKLLWKSKIFNALSKVQLKLYAYFLPLQESLLKENIGRDQ